MGASRPSRSSGRTNRMKRIIPPLIIIPALLLALSASWGMVEAVPAGITTGYGQGGALEGWTGLSYLHRTAPPATTLMAARSYLSATIAGDVFTMESVPEEPPYEVDASLVEWGPRHLLLELPEGCITPEEVLNTLVGEVRTVAFGQPFSGEVWLVVRVEELTGCP